MQDPDSGVTLKPDGSQAASVLQERLRGDGAADWAGRIRSLANNSPSCSVNSTKFSPLDAERT